MSFFIGGVLYVLGVRGGGGSLIKNGFKCPNGFFGIRKPFFPFIIMLRKQIKEHQH